MKHKNITIGTAGYARVRKITDAAVRKAIANNHATPGVVSREKVGKTWILTVNVLQLCEVTGMTEKNLLKDLEVTV